MFGLFSSFKSVFNGQHLKVWSTVSFENIFLFLLAVQTPKKWLFPAAGTDTPQRLRHVSQITNPWLVGDLFWESCLRVTQDLSGDNRDPRHRRDACFNYFWQGGGATGPTWGCITMLMFFLDFARLLVAVSRCRRDSTRHVMLKWVMVSFILVTLKMAAKRERDAWEMAAGCAVFH